MERTIEHGKSCLGESSGILKNQTTYTHTLTDLTLPQRTAESRNRKIRRPRVASSKHAEYRTRHTARHAPSGLNQHRFPPAGGPKCLRCSGPADPTPLADVVAAAISFSSFRLSHNGQSAQQATNLQKSVK